MRRLVVILSVWTAAAAAVAYWPGPTRSGRVTPTTREAWSMPSNLVRFAYHTVEHDCAAVTLCGWMRVSRAAVGVMVDPSWYEFSDGCPQTVGPDILAGGFAWPSGAVFAGETNLAVALADSQPYCVVGLASNQAVIDLGGNSITVTGVFDRVLAAGPSDAASLTTTGWARLGVVPVATNQWFGYADGLYDSEGGGLLESYSGIGTNWSWSAWVWRCTAATNWVDVQLCYPQGTGTCLRTAYRHTLTSSGRIRAGAQMRVGISSSYAAGAFQLFDLRAHDRALTDAELSAIYLDGYRVLQQRALTP